MISLCKQTAQRAARVSHSHREEVQVGARLHPGHPDVIWGTAEAGKQPQSKMPRLCLKAQSLCLAEDLLLFCPGHSSPRLAVCFSGLGRSVYWKEVRLLDAGMLSGEGQPDIVPNRRSKKQTRSCEGCLAFLVHVCLGLRLVAAPDGADILRESLWCWWGRNQAVSSSSKAQSHHGGGSVPSV